MPSYSLVLNSSNKISKNTFQYNFINGNLKVPEGSEISLSQVTVPYSFINVSSQLGNNTFQYFVPNSSNVQTGYTVTLSDGFYTLSDINTAMQKTMLANGHYWYAGGSVFTGSISTTTLTMNPTTQLVQLVIGSTISGNGITAGTTVTGQLTSTTYSLSVSNTAAAGTVMLSSQGNKLALPIIYPINLSLNSSLYTTTITSNVIPVGTDIQNHFGYGYARSAGYDFTTAWTGGYPTVGTICGYIQIPTTTSSTITIGNLLGFTAGSYPAVNTGLGATVLQQVTNGNSLTASPPFPILSTQVNGIVILCNLVENNIAMPSTILDSFPINATYGSNITYLPISDNAMKMRAGSYSNMTIQFVDQSFVPLDMLDQNVLISLIIRTPNKK